MWSKTLAGHKPSVFRRRGGFDQRHTAAIASRHGPNLGMPHTRAMGGGLFELRVKNKEGIARVFFCTVVGQRVIMLHGFIKKSEKTPPKELKMARLRQSEVKKS